MCDFDLLRDPWITCVVFDGGPIELGILDVLARSHELAEIVDPSPLALVGILRLCGAILQQNLELKDEDDWLRLWSRGSFEDRLCAAVVAACGERMRLFDALHPFYQSADIDPQGTDHGIKSVGALFLDLSTGTAVTHYNHRQEDDHALCEPCCVRGLVTLPAFATSGGQGIKPSINGVPPTYVLPLGRTVFQTLLLNYILPAYQPDAADSRDPGPFWSTEGIVSHKDERASAGFIESLTWQPRRVRLLEPRLPGTCTLCGRLTDNLTRHAVVMQGWSRKAEAPFWRDPWIGVNWQTEGSGTQVARPVRPIDGRATWRDTDVLFLARSEFTQAAGPTRPTVLNQMDYLIGDLEPDDASSDSCARFLAVGLRTNKAKVFEWRSDLFDFPHLMLQPGASSAVGEALAFAEAGASALGDALLRLHPDSERVKPKWKEIRAAMAGLTRAAQSRYWASAEPLFRRHVFDARLGGDSGAQCAWLDDWRTALRRAGHAALEHALAAQGDDASALRRQESARRAFSTTLKRKETTR